MPGSSGALFKARCELRCGGRLQAALGRLKPAPTSILIAVVALLLVAVAADAQPSARPPAANPNQALIDRYCVTCHNQRTKTSDLALDGVDITTPSADGEIWENVVRRLRTRSMPPQGMPRPDDATYGALASYLETELDKAGAAKPNPGAAQRICSH